MESGYILVKHEAKGLEKDEKHSVISPTQCGHSITIQSSLQELVCCDTYWDTVLVCKDGNLLHNKLTVGFLFPFLSQLPIFNLPIQTTILLPEYSVKEITSSVFTLLDIHQLESEGSVPQISESGEKKESDLLLFGKNVQTFKCGFCEASFSQLDTFMKHKKLHTRNCTSVQSSDLDNISFQTPIACINQSLHLEKQQIEVESPKNINKPDNLKEDKLDFQDFCDDFLSNDNDMFYINDTDKDASNDIIPEDDTANDDTEADKKQVKSKSSKKKNRPTSLSSAGTRSAKRSYAGEIFPGPYPYKCSYCDKRFKQVGHVNLHERTHTGGQKYICPWCKKKFNQLSHLKDHERIHTGEKPFMCSDCGKCFGYNSALKSHKKIHTGEKTYKCNFCEKTFNQLGNLRTHERLHTGELKYMCSECGKCYNTRSNLTRHACIRLAAENTTGSMRLDEDQMMHQFEIQEQKLLM